MFDADGCERLGVILARVSTAGSRVRLLGREFVPVPPEEIVRQSRGAVEASPSFSRRLMERCSAGGLSQLDVHSHPFGPDPGLEFSGVDDREERVMAAYIHERLPKSYYGSLVANQGYWRGRVWLKTPRGPEVRSIDSVKLLESPLQVIDT